MIRSYGNMVRQLGPNDVFVFGSNEQGFHGAGAAGFASFGRPGNVWRDENYASKPIGWKGKWNVKGQAEGMQEGTDGKSYAIPTVKQAGNKRSLSRNEIVNNIRKMYVVASSSNELTFLVAGSSDGKPPLNGYSHDEMASMFSEAGPIPGNVVFSASYAVMIDALTGHAQNV